MDNPSALKHLISPTVVKKIATSLGRFDKNFNQKKFLKITQKLDSLELKERVKLVTSELKNTLPESYPAALEIIVKSIKDGELKGFELWPYSEYISQFGLLHFDLSLRAMKELTIYFTSEFAVRPFLLKDHSKVLKFLSKLTNDKNVHIRRWISEGTRPLLPWGERIPLFVMDPTHTLILLDKLKFDEELYVRKSVANHLNDISKNHPQVVIEIIRLWEKSCPPNHQEKLLWIKRHALRTLIKKGFPAALKLMGVNPAPKAKIGNLKLNSSRYKINEVMSFEFALTSLEKVDQKIIVDYGIDFMKSSGKTGKKIFKLKSFILGPGETVVLKKKHSFKEITTLKFYPGTHHLSIQVNGVVMGQVSFDLKV